MKVKSCYNEKKKAWFMKEAMIDNKKGLGKDRTRTHYNNKFRSLSLKKICVCRF